MYLLVDDSAQPRLALDNGVRNTHLAAECRQEYDKLNRVDVVGDQNEAGLLVLDQADNVVEAILCSIRLLADVLLLLAIGHGRGLLVQALLLLGLGLGPVLVEELEGLRGEVAVKGVLELRNGRRNLEAEVENLLLALQADVFGPPDHAREVALRLDVLADAKVARALLEERVLRIVSRSRNE